MVVDGSQYFTCRHRFVEARPKLFVCQDCRHETDTPGFVKERDRQSLLFFPISVREAAASRDSDQASN